MVKTFFDNVYCIYIASYMICHLISTYMKWVWENNIKQAFGELFL